MPILTDRSLRRAGFPMWESEQTTVFAQINLAR
jgi:hypothetical protein